MNTTYILTSKKLNGIIELSYLNGVLTVIKFDLKPPMNQQQYGWFKDCLSQNETYITHLAELGFTITKQAATNEKIAIFCQLYENKVGIKYKVSPADSGKMKNLNADRAMLEFYFASDNFLFKGKWSINNLTKYYNELRAEIASSGKSKYPDYWSLEFENKLSTQQLMYDYWAHLRSLGLEPKKDRTGKTIEWIKKTNG